MPLTEVSPGVNRLPRGGYLVPTSVGYIQFGAPPETIKDTMVLPQAVPKIFVLPGELFHVEKGISVAELEFPIYYNHFLKQRKTYILCTEEQKEQLQVVLQESVFGPENIDLRSEYPQGELAPGFPNMRAEMGYFRENRQLKDLVSFAIFKNDKIRINSVVVQRKAGEGFEVYEEDKLIASVPWTIEYHIQYDIGERPHEPFNPPELGITCLGPSHGFDPHDNTSGFILWINKHGIMVDPPVNSTEWLRDSNVNPKWIRHVILTHCHADHDAGTFQKILEEGMVTIHTTETIMDSFIRKYHAMTKIPKIRLYELFAFNPVQVDTSIYIEGAEFLFHYALHSIPSLGFRFHFRNQSFLYTSDHLNHPVTLEKMNEKGIFPPGRFEFLMNFPWHYKIIYHEAGIPPLHTPVSYLASLPEAVQKRITVYHIAKKDFLKDSSLSLAKFGIENTLYPEIDPPRFPKAYQILDILSSIDLFSDFPIHKAKEFLSIVEEKQFPRGEFIIRKGDPGEEFFIIASGNIRVEGTASGVVKSFGNFEYFGEASLISGEPRSANVIAETDVVALTIAKDRFLNFIRGTNLEQTFKQLASVRESNSWLVLSQSQDFSGMTSMQKTQLESLLTPIERMKGETLVAQCQPAPAAFIIESGKIALYKENTQIKILETGDFVGEIFSIQKETPAPFSAVVLEDARLFQIQPADLTRFIRKNPGIYMRLMTATAELLN